MPKRVQIIFFIIAKFISVLVLSRVALSFGYILMEDLHRAVAQFYPSTSGGMPGGSAPLPGPSGNSGSGWTSLLASGNESSPSGSSEGTIGQPPHAAQPHLVGEIDQDDLFAAAEAQELADLTAQMQSREWRAADRHFSLCEEKVQTIISEINSQRISGRLDLNLQDPEDIKRGVEVFFSDLTMKFDKNEQRLGHLKRVYENIGNPRSHLWKDLLKCIKDF